MNVIDETLIELSDAVEPMELNGENIDEDIIAKVNDLGGREIYAWTCSTCSKVLKGTINKFLEQKWAVIKIASSQGGWTGYVRLTACPACRDGPEAKKRLELLNLLDNWNAEAKK